MDVETLACVDSSLMVSIRSVERLEQKRQGREGPGMLLKFAAPLLLFSSSALQTANNASYENTNDQDRCVFPIAQLNFPFEII